MTGGVTILRVRKDQGDRTLSVSLFFLFPYDGFSEQRMDKVHHICGPSYWEIREKIIRDSVRSKGMLTGTYRSKDLCPQADSE